jgi:chromosomal replication initiator protein
VLTTLGEGWPSADPQPLIYLLGPSGVGKSALARLALQTFQKQHPQALCESLTASQFSAQLAEASDDHTIPLFQAALRELDLLILEDLSSIEGRPETVQQLLNLLNTLEQRGSRVVVTASRPPGTLAGFPARLVSRLRGGVTLRIQPGDAEARARLLQHFARHARVPLPQDTAIWLGNRLTVTNAELVSVIPRLAALGRQHHRPLDLELARRLLAQDEPPTLPTPAAIGKAVATEFAVKLAELRSSSRTRQLAFPRQVAMWLTRHLLGTSLQEVGAFYGGRDHTTVVHACQQITRLLESDPLLQSRVEKLKRQLLPTGT